MAGGRRDDLPRRKLFADTAATAQRIGGEEESELWRTTDALARLPERRAASDDRESGS